MTTTQFAPTSGAPFQFQATLLGPTSNVSSTGTTFNISIPWNTFGQRWWVQIVDQNGSLVLNRALVASTPDFPINLVAGWFSGSSLVFYDDSQIFEVLP